MTNAEYINSRLARDYTTSDRKPLFRLVWSEKIFEHRFGTYNDFTESGLFIRQVTETRLVRKYSYIHERFIFEKWAPGNLTANKETPDALNGDYIPVYVFEDSKGKYLSPNDRSVDFIISYLSGKIRQDIMPSEEYLAEKEIAHQVEAMDIHPTFQTRPGESRDSIAYNKGLKNV